MGYGFGYDVRKLIEKYVQKYFFIGTFASEQLWSMKINDCFDLINCFYTRIVMMGM